VLSLAILDANHIASASDDHSIKIWNLSTALVEQTLNGHNDSVNALTVLDRNRIISASSDCTLKVWNLHTSEVIASIGLDGALTCVAVTRQHGRTLVVAGDAGGALYCLELVEPVAGN
jgi:WD40 repeat protein